MTTRSTSWPPLKSASPTRRTEQQAALRNVRERRGNGPHDGMDEADRLERSIQKRKWIYEHDLYAKHVGSNKYTKYRHIQLRRNFPLPPI
ncbi:hypothetical protein FA13DRAFT_1141172 [Coprinellus micaceus]|uniref:Uncharacterized protein n=1 Tax=Coprinellus micaceus TaxID=71717 RepID=A0A4Y7SV21_COPMI|nr:hypothetical protein FA13DRAFT_1141172 [Coprinellus micaceus]